jgi:small subunit ribosomal protein S16
MIRLARVGARKQPHYRVVVIEKDRARNGRSVEVVGTYNPRTEPATVEFKHDRITYWTAKGAQMSETVGKLLVKNPYVAPSETPAAPVAEPVAAVAVEPVAVEPVVETAAEPVAETPAETVA